MGAYVSVGLGLKVIVRVCEVRVRICIMVNPIVKDVRV